MKVVNYTVNLQGERWCSLLIMIYMYTKHTYKLRSTMMVFLGILDISNGEGGSSIDG